MLKNKRWLWAAVLAVFLTADALLLLSVLTAPRSITSALLPTAEYLEQNPAPTPEFISDFRTVENKVCIDVSQRPFARENLSAQELSTYIMKHEQFKIDGVVVTPNLNVWVTTSLSLEDGKEYGGPLTFCFDTENLSAGLHLASIAIPDLDGVEHTYSWAFRHDPNFPTADPNILPTLAPLPTETPSA